MKYIKIPNKFIKYECVNDRTLRLDYWSNVDLENCKLKMVKWDETAERFFNNISLVDTGFVFYVSINNRQNSLILTDAFFKVFNNKKYKIKIIADGNKTICFMPKSNKRNKVTHLEIETKGTLCVLINHLRRLEKINIRARNVESNICFCQNLKEIKFWTDLGNIDIVHDNFTETGLGHKNKFYFKELWNIEKICFYNTQIFDWENWWDSKKIPLKFCEINKNCKLEFSPYTIFCLPCSNWYSYYYLSKIFGMFACSKEIPNLSTVSLVKTLYCKWGGEKCADFEISNVIWNKEDEDLLRKNNCKEKIETTISKLKEKLTEAVCWIDKRDVEENRDKILKEMTRK